MQPFGGAAKVQLFGNGGEVAQMPELDHSNRAIQLLRRSCDHSQILKAMIKRLAVRFSVHYAYRGRLPLPLVMVSSNHENFLRVHCLKSMHISQGRDFGD